MYREMTLDEFIGWCNKMAEEIPALMKREMEDARYEALMIAFDLSEGPYDKRDQDAMYERPPWGGIARGPYSRVYPHPPLAAEVINVRTGMTHFRSMWVRDEVLEKRDGLYSRVYNEAPQAGYLYNDESAFADGGTKKAIGRPLPEKICGELEEPLLHVLENDIGNLLMYDRPKPPRAGTI